MNGVNGANGGNNQPSTTKLTIKKNQGITQALFDLVKQMKSEGKAEISVGKITAQEWNQTINKNAELQRIREENDGQKIYSGGSDPKDYRGSFIVQPNQEIEFTAEEMNALYEGMGVTVKSNAPATTATPTVPAAPEVPQDAAADNIPKNDANPPSASTPPEVSPLTLIEQNRNMLNRDKLMKDFASDNSYEYDEDGYVTHTYDKNGKVTREILSNFRGKFYCYDYEYDADGNRTRLIAHANGKVIECCDYEYDADGNLTKEISRKADGTVDYYEVYEGDKWVKYNSDGTKKE